MSHFYDSQGAPCHYQPKKKGGLRPTTIADARKLGLYPSVSTILACLHKEQLVQKMMEKVALQARHTAFEHIESGVTVTDNDQFVDYVKEAAFADWGNAQDLGSRIHKAIELNMGPAGLVPEDDLAPYVLPAVAKVKELGIVKKEAECVIVSHEHGYAGTTDLTGYFTDTGTDVYDRLIADFKSTKTKPGKKVDGWDSQVMQLAAYHKGYWGEILPNDHAYNIYISTTEPGRVEAVKRTSEELQAAFKAFLALCEVYFWMNDYDPRKNT